MLDEPTDTGLHETLENANAEICSLRQLSEKQRLAIMECKCLLSDTEEKVTELALKNQQLAKLLAETEARETELVLENQQLTESLAGTEEKMTKLVLECEQLREHSSGSEVERLKRELLQAKERDNELESLKKQTGMKSAVTTSLQLSRLCCLDTYSSGATNVGRLLPFYIVNLHRDTLLPNQTVPVLPQHVSTTVLAMESQHHRSYLGSLICHQQWSQDHMYRYPHELFYLLCHFIQGYLVLSLVILQGLCLQ
ncbi:uncharacterized protein [Dysidea avara]|uniref:uncharacterized protein n=1 Tax=Dysidea avara TaxID=196820 RepID=UPI00331765EA